MNVSLPGGENSLCANQSDMDLALGITEAQVDDVNALLGTKANQSDFCWIMHVYLKHQQTWIIQFKRTQHR